MVQQLDIFETSDSVSNLKPRQWALWRLIEHNSLVEHRKTSQKEICDKLSEYGYVYDNNELVHDHCVAIWKDIKDNNESMEHQKIIISKNFEYWIGSEEETNLFLKDLWKALEPRLSRYWNYYKKLKKHNQGRLYDKNGNAIDDDSKANAFFNCFNDYNVSMQKDSDKSIKLDAEKDFEYKPLRFGWDRLEEK